MDESRRVQTVFYAGDTPPVPKGHMQGFIVTVSRAGHPARARRMYTFAAQYLNQYPLDMDGGCEAEDCQDKHDDGCPATGWFEDRAHSDYENFYTNLLGEGDQVVEWAALPGPPEESAGE